MILRKVLPSIWAYRLVMPTYPNPASTIPAVLLAAGLALARIHGPYYAQCFLEDHGVDSSVIRELLEGTSRTTSGEGQLRSY